DLEPLLAQHVRQSIAVAFLVFDDEHPGHDVASFCRSLGCSMRRPVRCSMRGAMGGSTTCVGTRTGSAAGSVRSGSRSVKVDPSPSTLHTVTEPPWLLATC